MTPSAVGDGDAGAGGQERPWTWKLLAFDPPPALVLYATAQDCAGILDRFIAFHLAQGVDVLLIAHCGSQDATGEILAEWSRTGRVVTTTASDAEPHALRSELAHWVSTWSAKWAIDSAPNEFWMPRVGTLRAVFAALPDSAGAVYGQVRDFLASDQPCWRADGGGPLRRKVAHRGNVDGPPFVWPLIDVLRVPGGRFRSSQGDLARRDARLGVDERFAAYLHGLEEEGALSPAYWAAVDRETSWRHATPAAHEQAALDNEVRQALAAGAQRQPSESDAPRQRQPSVVTAPPPSSVVGRFSRPRTNRGVARLDAIFVINLASRPERLAEFEAEMSRLCSPFERFDAIERESGHLGCTLSHAGCLEQMLSRRYEAVMVCEDDVSFIADRGRLDALVDAFLDDASAEVACLSFNSFVQHPYSDLYERTTHNNSSGCYVVKAGIASDLLRLLRDGAAGLARGEPLTVWTIDQIWKRLQHDHVFLVPREPTAAQRPSFSDVEGRHYAPGV